MADSPHIVEIDEANYEQIVLEGSCRTPVLVDFWASWCQPCQILMPVLAKLADEYQGRFVLAKLNTEEQQAIAAQFGIRSIPTVKLFRDGAPVDEFMGALPEAEIRAFLDRHLPRESDGAVVQAEQRLRAGDGEGALALLRQAQTEDPSNPRVVTAIAQVQAATGDPEGAEQTLAGLPQGEQDEPDIVRLRAQLFFDRVAAAAGPHEAAAQRLAVSPDDSEARGQVAAHQVLENNLEGAAENLFQLMQRDRKFGDDGARTALLKLFDILGEDPAVTRYRARLFALLH